MLGRGPRRTRQAWSAGTCQGPPHRRTPPAPPTTLGALGNVLSHSLLATLPGLPANEPRPSAEHTRREAGVPALAGSAAREHRRSRPAIAPGSVKDTSHRQAGRHGPEGAETLNTRRAREDAPRPADGGVSRQETAGPGPPHSGAPGGQRGGGARLPPTADTEGPGPRREDPAHYVISLALSFFLKTPGWSDFIVHAFRESR